MTRLRPPVVAFDIGGTWTRCGVYSSGGNVTNDFKERTVSHLSSQFSQADIQSHLVERISMWANQCAQTSNQPIKDVVISFGGALNAFNGEIYNAGPVWGRNEGVKFELVKHLSATAPDLNWRIINDISAHLLWYVHNYSQIKTGKTMLITISSGIGCRIYDHDAKTIPVDKKLGIQGEIGHVPIPFSVGAKPYQAVCDCGIENHLNAFCSGNALERNWSDYLSAVSDIKPPVVTNDEIPKSRVLRRMLDNGEPPGIEVLRALTLPIAHILQVILTLDPSIREVVFTGGLFHTLNPYYMENLWKHLDEMGIYIVDQYDRCRVERTFLPAPDDPLAGIKGAGIYMNLGKSIAGKFEAL